MEQLLSEESLHQGLHHLSLLQLKPGCTSFDASKMTSVRLPVSSTRTRKVGVFSGLVGTGVYILCWNGKVLESK